MRESAQFLQQAGGLTTRWCHKKCEIKEARSVQACSRVWRRSFKRSCSLSGGGGVDGYSGKLGGARGSGGSRKGVLFAFPCRREAAVKVRPEPETAAGAAKTIPQSREPLAVELASTVDKVCEGQHEAREHLG